LFLNGKPGSGIDRIMLGITNVKWGSDGSFALEDLGEVEL
jgi:hypothetical protein